MLLLMFLAYMGKHNSILISYTYVCIYLAFSIPLYVVCLRLREDLEAAAFDNQSSSLIKLNNGTILYLREVNKFLALVCILREDNFDRQGKNNDYNYLCIYVV